jgi:hypothetical protein
MANNKASSRGKRDEMYSFDRLIVSVHRSPVGIAWRWRTELAVLIFLITALIALSFISPLSGPASSLALLLHVTQCPLWVSCLIWGTAELAVLIGVLFCLPVTCRFIVARCWCVLARHRFQRLCWEARLHTRAGRLPVVLWVRPTKVGERLFVLCRAGIAAEDFEQHTGELRAACYARDARVTRNTRWSHLVTIDIIRRDTLSASHAPDSLFKQLLNDRARTAEPVPALAGADDDTGESGPPPWPEATFTNPE